MLISKKWLSQFVTLPEGVSDADLAKKLTLSTVEVEGVIDQASALEKVIVGLVVSCAQHPNADRLKVCQVDVGGRVTQIVCGGTNVREGMKVAVALPGSRVRWHGEGDLVELAKTKIRGEESEGMICAGVEIGMEKSGEGEHEIMDLGAIADAPGTPLAKALGRDDVVFEIEHKSLTNRPDLMGHYGMAREVAALYGTFLKPYTPAAIPEGVGHAFSVSVDDPALCPRYMTVALEGVRVALSPAWVRERLLSCGVRSINNVVDVTNLVMLEYGQPMHAFDADAVGEAIHVRLAKKGEKILCLDDKTYDLDPEMLVIADATRPIAIAGVMGGKESAVTDATTRIMFESANFSPVSVRKTSTKLSLRSESSARFEKSLDREQCEAALRRAVELLQELSPGAHVASPVKDVQVSVVKPVVIALPEDAIERRLGVSIPVMEVGAILNRLGFTLEREGRGFSVTIPTWRATKDISIMEDLVEEVARIYGYDRIPSALPPASITPPPQDPVRLFARRARHVLAGLGASEAYRYAFVRPETLSALGFTAADHVKLANPLSTERPYLAQSLLPNLTEAVLANHRTFPRVELFQIDRVFFGSGEEEQPYHLAIAFTEQGNEAPFVQARQTAEELLSRLGLAVSFCPVTHPGTWMHPGRAADILIDGKKKGIVAEMLPSFAEALGIDRRVALIEMNLSMLASVPSRLPTFDPIPAYPDAKRDLAFVVDERAVFGEIEKALRAASPLLVSLELFDVYRGKGVEAGKKSVAIHLTFRSLDRTLSSEEADGEVKKLVEVIEKGFGGMMRGL